MIIKYQLGFSQIQTSLNHTFVDEYYFCAVDPAQIVGKSEETNTLLFQLETPQRLGNVFAISFGEVAPDVYCQCHGHEKLYVPRQHFGIIIRQKYATKVRKSIKSNLKAKCQKI